MSEELPYITKEYVTYEREYNPAYGDDRVCVCGHAYYRHFDSYENNDPVGCKYCGCGTFRERATAVRWILEENVFSEKCFYEMVAVFRDKNICYDRIKIIPFVHEIDGRKPRKHDGPTIVYGSLGVQKVAEKEGWIPGVFGSEENFQMDVYRDKLGDLFLNSDLEYMMMSDVEDYLRLAKLEKFFIKPRGDMKQFAGIVLTRDHFREWYDNMVSIGYLDDNDFEVIISTPKELGCEWRLVVVNNQIVGSSLYRQYQQVMPERHWLCEVNDVVYKAMDLFEPAPIYIIDVAQFGNEYKIIEYNTFNSAGFYECDVEAIIEAVTAFVNKTYEEII